MSTDRMRPPERIPPKYVPFPHAALSLSAHRPPRGPSHHPRCTFCRPTSTTWRARSAGATSSHWRLSVTCGSRFELGVCVCVGGGEEAGPGVGRHIHEERAASYG
eukprot:scaffold19909_cov130-Isochrysis_galbana.AAC.11